MEKSELIRIQKIVDEVKATFEKLGNATERAAEIINNMEKERMKLAKSLPKCPLCGSKIKGKLK